MVFDFWDSGQPQRRDDDDDEHDSEEIWDKAEDAIEDGSAGLIQGRSEFIRDAFFRDDEDALRIVTALHTYWRYINIPDVDRVLEVSYGPVLLDLLATPADQLQSDLVRERAIRGAAQILEIVSLDVMDAEYEPGVSRFAFVRYRVRYDQVSSEITVDSMLVLCDLQWKVYSLQATEA